MSETLRTIRPPRSPQSLSMSEKELTKAIIDLGRILGARVAHFRAAQTGKGWRTPVQGDGKGWLDLVIITRNFRFLIRETKVGRNKLTPEQERWMADCRAAGIDADLWTDADLHNGRIFKELTQ